MSSFGGNPNLCKLCELGYKHLLKHVIIQLICKVMGALFPNHLIILLVSLQNISKDYCLRSTLETCFFITLWLKWSFPTWEDLELNTPKWEFLFHYLFGFLVFGLLVIPHPPPPLPFAASFFSALLPGKILYRKQEFQLPKLF